jgi:uncharacterized protein (DUF1501 family)
MKRRDFIIRSSGAAAVPFLLNGLPVRAFDGPVLQRLLNGETETDHVLVLIQLNGGNDGINTVLPLDQYERYMTVRANIAIPENKALKLTDATGLHPAMTEVGRLYADKKAVVVQGVGYPNPNLSHFRSTDIWNSASDSNVYVGSGWLGRYLETAYPGYPSGYPNASTPDPIAIQISAVTSLALAGPAGQSMGIALQDPDAFYNLVSGTELGGDPLPDEQYAHDNVEYVRKVQSQSLEYSEVIKAAADKAQNKVEYPANNRLAQQLQIVARLVAGGLKTRVYVVQLGGFDTHSAQVTAGDTTTGVHATLLQTVSQAVDAFQRDIEALEVDQRVVSMTYSEFGRRVASNVSLGTDHGTSAPLFVFGTPVNAGIIGVNSSLTDTKDGNLTMQYDFRQVYASILEQWFNVEATTLREILYKDFVTLPIIRVTPTSVAEELGTSAFTLGVASPNPVQDVALIPYAVGVQSRVHLAVYDKLGFHVVTLVDQMLTPGTYTVPFSAQGLPSGSYVVQMRTERERKTSSLVIVR